MVMGGCLPAKDESGTLQPASELGQGRRFTGVIDSLAAIRVVGNPFKHRSGEQRPPRGISRRGLPGPAGFSGPPLVFHSRRLVSASPPCSHQYGPLSEQISQELDIARRRELARSPSFRSAFKELSSTRTSSAPEGCSEAASMLPRLDCTRRLLLTSHYGS